MAAITILANEACLAKRGLTAEDLVAVLAEAGLEATSISLPDDEAGLASLGAKLAANPPAIAVAAGGDGTIHQVVNLIAGLGIPLGVLPLGTANDFARGLDLPTDLAAAAAIIAEESPLAIDLGRLTGDGGVRRYFINAAHLGLGVETAKQMDLEPGLKHWLGPMAYGMAAVRAWQSAETLSFELCTDQGCVSLLASQLLVGVGRFFGGGAQLAKPALDTGLFEVYTLAAELTPGRALGAAAAMKLGTLSEHPDTLHASTARLVVKLERPAEVDMDGEIFDMGQELHFEVLPGGLSVYARGTAAETSFDPLGVALPRLAP